MITRDLGRDTVDATMRAFLGATKSPDG